MTGRALDFRRPELQPELGRLVHGLEEELVRMRPLLRRFLQRKQLVRAEIALVVGCAPAGENRLGEVLVRLGRHRGGAYFGRGGPLLRRGLGAPTGCGAARAANAAAVTG